MAKPRVSIIIRAKNEERWIGACLKAVMEQTVKDVELILVDNRSTDKTVEKAKKFPVKVLVTDDYLPGRAINLGVRASQGEFFVCLSAHCIPRNPTWLENLLKNFDDTTVAGVYGRQEPMAQTSAQDKRDLLNTFGLDRRVQLKDSFFHNANSMVRRSAWDAFPFDENVTNIEDRVWGQLVVSKGHKLVYEPDASVYHYHGIHQDGNSERCKNVVRILESLDLAAGTDEHLLKDLNVVAIIPVKGDPIDFCGESLLSYTVTRAKQSDLIKQIVVSTDSPRTAELAKKLGVQAPFLRSASLSSAEVGIEDVLKFTLEKIEDAGTLPDVIVSLNSQFPFRSVDLLDNLIRLQFEKGFDSVFAGYPTYRSCWVEGQDGIKRIDQGFHPHSLKKPVHVGYVGLGCVTFPRFLREGRLLGEKVGILEMLDPYSVLEVKDDATSHMAAQLFPAWWKLNGQKKSKLDPVAVGSL